MKESWKRVVAGGMLIGFGLLAMPRIGLTGAQAADELKPQKASEALAEPAFQTGEAGDPLAVSEPTNMGTILVLGAGVAAAAAGYDYLMAEDDEYDYSSDGYSSGGGAFSAKAKQTPSGCNSGPCSSDGQLQSYCQTADVYYDGYLNCLNSGTYTEAECDQTYNAHVQTAELAQAFMDRATCY